MPILRNHFCIRPVTCLLLLFFCLSLGGWAQPLEKERFAKLLPDDRVSFLFNDVFSHLETNLAIAKLDSLQLIASALKDDRMLAYSKLLHAMVSCVGKSYPEQQNKILDACAPIAEQSPYDDVKGSYYFFRGIVAFRNKDFTIAPPFLALARRLLESAGYHDYSYAYIYDDGFFSMYYYFEDYQTAASFCQEAINNLKKTTYKLLQYYYSNLGECYLKLKKFTQAEVAFEEGIAAAEKAGDSNFRALIIGNRGKLLRVQGRYKQALPFLYINANINEKAIPEDAALSRLYISNSLLQLDSAKKAKQYLNPPTFEMPYWTFPEYDIMRFETWALYYHKTGNYKLQAQFQDSLINLQDSVKTVFDIKKLSAMESSLQAEKYLSDKKEMKLKAHSEKITRNLIIAVLVLLFAGVFFWLNYRRRTEKLMETQKLAEANLQLEQYVMHLRDKNELIEQMTTELQGMYSVNTSSETQQYLANLQTSVILTEDDWQEFKKLFERAFPDFFQRLSSQYPGLTPAEVRLLALEKLQLPTKDMANMLGISADSIRKNRYRLRKKFPDSIPLRASE